MRGLARMVQVSPQHCIVDLSVKGLSPGQYQASVRENGDISQGALSTGGVWQGGNASEGPPRGSFGELEVDGSGSGSLLLQQPVEIWELIGRSFVVSQMKEGLAANDDPNTVCGVIARSAGVWENQKTVSPPLSKKQRSPLQGADLGGPKHRCVHAPEKRYGRSGRSSLARA